MIIKLPVIAWGVGFSLTRRKIKIDKIIPIILSLADFIDKATDIATSWIKKGYNIGQHAKNLIPVEFTLYSYINNTTIKKGIQIKGKPYSDKIKIIGYKNNDIQFVLIIELSVIFISFNRESFVFHWCSLVLIESHILVHRIS